MRVSAEGQLSEAGLPLAPRSGKARTRQCEAVKRAFPELRSPGEDLDRFDVRDPLAAARPILTTPATPSREFTNGRSAEPHGRFVSASSRWRSSSSSMVPRGPGRSATLRWNAPAAHRRHRVLLHHAAQVDQLLVTEAEEELLHRLRRLARLHLRCEELGPACSTLKVSRVSSEAPIIVP